MAVSLCFMQIQDWQLPIGVQALCTTRLGGVSLHPYDSLNLGDHVQDDPAHVAANRNILKEQLHGARPVFLKQVHGTQVMHLDLQTIDGTVADACYTQTPKLACTIMVADCMPILLTDLGGTAVAAVHAGWRGLAYGVIENTVETLCQQGGVSPHNLLVWLGPCIGPSAFEVGAEVREIFLKADANSGRWFKPLSSQPGKYLADLPALARERLRSLGVLSVAGNDGGGAWCTVQQSSRFFSYRRDGVTGRFAACIWRTR